MNYETILVAHRGPSALITLNRPDKLNAMSLMMKEEIIRALRDLDADTATRAIVITGAGQKAFTAGAGAPPTPRGPARAPPGQTEINIGIIPGGGASQRLPRLVGLGIAMKLALTGERIDAKEAQRIGLLDEVVPHARLERRTFEIADRIASKSAVAVRLAKAAIRASARLPLDQGLRYEQSLFALALSTEDKEEGVAAFLEKREAKWKDR